MRVEFPADLGLGVPVLMSLLSLRLFRLAARTRRLPELLVGVYFLLVPFAISLAIRVDRFDPAHAAWVRAVSNGLFTVGGIALLLFAWCVFRPDRTWAKALAWGGSAVLAATWLGGLARGAYQSGSSVFLLLPTYLSYFWVFFESLRYYLLLRRRQRLGLGDPVLTNRFLLFAVWTGSVSAITVLGLAGSLAQVARGVTPEGAGLGGPLVLTLTRLLAIPIGVSLWLTFLAPARYLAWLRRSATERAPA